MILKLKKYKVRISPDSAEINTLQAGDIVNRQYFDGKSTIYTLMYVDSVGVDVVDKDGVKKDSPYFIGQLIYGDEPKTGELLNFVRVTSLSNSARGGALYLTSSDSDSPYMDVIDVVDRDNAVFILSGTGGMTPPNSKVTHIQNTDEYFTEIISDLGGDGLLFSVPNGASKSKRDVVDPVLLGFMSIKPSKDTDMEIFGSTFKLKGGEYNDIFIPLDSSDMMGSHLPMDIHLTNIGSVGDSFYIKGLIFVSMASMTGFSDGVKVRVGQLSGVIDEHFGALDSYGAYFQKLYATKDVNIAGTLSAGSKDGQQAVFYVGKIRTNAFTNSLKIEMKDNPAEKYTYADNPVGIGEMYRSKKDTSFYANKDKLWHLIHAGSTVCFSMFVMSLHEKESVTLNIGENDIAVKMATNGWNRVYFYFSLPEDAENTVITIRDADVAFCAPQLEFGVHPTIYQPTDEVSLLDYGKGNPDYGMWATKGGFGGTIQNPVVSITEEGVFIGDAIQATRGGVKIDLKKTGISDAIDKRAIETETRFEIKEGQISSTVTQLETSLAESKTEVEKAQKAVKDAESIKTSSEQDLLNAKEELKKAQDVANSNTASTGQAKADAEQAVKDAQKKVDDAQVKANEAATEAAKAKAEADKAALVGADVTKAKTEISQTAESIKTTATQVATDASSAKTQAEIATKKATEASTSATTATTKATEATKKASEADKKAQEALASAGASSESYLNAKVEAEKANADALKAGIDAKKASDEALKAKQEADKASSSLSQVIEKETSINQTAEGIETTAKEVSVNASKAEAQAKLANTKATEAQTSASTAQAKATEADKKAKEADLKAQEALASAGASSQSYKDAQAEAVKANTEAKNAKTQADKAVTEAAKAKAEADKAALALGSVTEKETSINQTAEAVNVTASQVTADKDSISEMKTEIEATAEGISLTATNASAEALKAKQEADKAALAQADVTKKQAEIKVTSDSITQTASEVSTNAEQVKKDAESATKSATAAQTNANNAQVQANNAQKKAEEAQAEANKAKLDANASAQSKLDAQKKADEAKAEAARAQTEANKANADATKAKQEADKALSAQADVVKRHAQIETTAQGVNISAQEAKESADRATKAEASINVKAGEIVMEASSKAAEKAIDGLDISIENMLLGTNFDDKLSKWNIQNKDNVSTIKTDFGVNGVHFLRKNATSVIYIIVRQYLDKSFFDVGSSYTYSIWIKGDNAVAIDHSFESGIVVSYKDGTRDWGNVNINKDIWSTEKWTRVSRTFTILKEVSSIYCRMQLAKNGSITACMPYLQRGKKLTWWTPSLLDATNSLIYGGENLLNGTSDVPLLWGSNAGYYVDRGTNYKLIEGETYSFSTYMKVDDDRPLGTANIGFGSRANVFTVDGMYTEPEIIDKANKIYKYTWIFTFKINPKWSHKGDWYFAYRVRRMNESISGLKTFLYCEMLENGNTPSDWKPSKSDIQKQIDSKASIQLLDDQIKATVASTDGKISTVTQKNNEIEAEVKANKKATDGSITSLNTRVTQTETKISQAVTKTEYDANNKKVGEKLTKIEQDVDGVEIIAKSAESKIDGLEIGGRNYALNSDVVRGGTPATHAYQSITWQISSKNNRISEDLADNMISYSFKVIDYYSAKGISKIATGVYNLTKTKWLSSIKVVDIPENRIIINEGLLIPSNVDGDNIAIFTYYNVQGQVQIGDILSLSQVMIVKGNKIIDWSPAPEDIVQESVTKSEASIKVETDKITAQVNANKVDADGKITGLNTRVTQTEKSITSKVSQTEYDANNKKVGTKISAIEQKSDSIELSVKSGGGNILLNSNNNRQGWENSGYPSATIYFQEQLKEGDKFTIRLYGELGVGATYWGIYNSGGTISPMSLMSNHKYGDYYEASGTWTVKGMTNKYINIYAMPRSNTVSKIYKVMMVKGTVGREWSPNYMDVPTSFKLTKDGIDMYGQNISLIGKVTFNMMAGADPNDYGTIIEGGTIKTKYLNVQQIVTDGITANTFKGKNIIVDTGTIGGWKITANTIENTNIVLEANGGIKSKNGKWVLAQDGSAKFTSGEIGGWKITDASLVSKNNQLTLNPIGQITSKTGNDVLWNLGADGSIQLGKKRYNAQFHPIEITNSVAKIGVFSIDEWSIRTENKQYINNFQHENETIISAKSMLLHNFEFKPPATSPTYSNRTYLKAGGETQLLISSVVKEHGSSNNITVNSTRLGYINKLADDSNAAISITMKHESLYYDTLSGRNRFQNPQKTALRIKGGNIAGFGLNVVTYEENQTFQGIDDSSTFLIFIGNKNLTLNIPHPASTWIGRVLMFYNRGAKWLQLKSLTPPFDYTEPIRMDVFRYGKSAPKDRWSMNDGQVGFIINDGAYWNCSFFDWSSSQW